jgi:hypothetical protein
MNDTHRRGWVRAALILALVVLLVAPLALSVDAAGPWLEVRFLRVLVNGIFDGDLTIGDDLTVDDSATITGDTVAGGTLDVADAVTMADALDVTGNTTITGTLDVSGVSTLATISQAVSTENVMLPSVVAASVDIDNDSSPATLFTIADGEVWAVTACFANVLEDFGTGGSDDAVFTVGDGSTADLFLDLADAELQAADDDGGAAGWQGFTESTQGTGLDAGSGSPLIVMAPSGSATNIVATFSGTGLAGDGTEVDDITVYMIYWRLQ